MLSLVPTHSRSFPTFSCNGGKWGLNWPSPLTRQDFLFLFLFFSFSFSFYLSLSFSFPLFLFLFFLSFFFFLDRVSLYNPGCPGTHSIDQAVLELRNPPVSASQVLGLKVCTTTAQLFVNILWASKALKMVSNKQAVINVGWHVTVFVICAIHKILKLCKESIN